MMSLINGKTLKVMVFVNKETPFKEVDSILAYAIKGRIKRGCTKIYETYYEFEVWPSMITDLIAETKIYKIKVRVID